MTSPSPVFIDWDYRVFLSMAAVETVIILCVVIAFVIFAKQG